MGSNVVTVNCEGYEQSGQLEARYVTYSGDILARSSPFTWKQLPSSQATPKTVSQLSNKATVQVPSKASPKSNFIEVIGSFSDRSNGELNIKYYYSSAKDGDFIALCQDNDAEGVYMVYNYVNLDSSEISLDCSGYIDTLKDLSDNQNIKCVVRYYNGESITKLKTNSFFYFEPPARAPKPKVKEQKAPSKPSPSPSPVVPSYAPQVNTGPVSSNPSIPQRPAKAPSPSPSSSISAPPTNKSPSLVPSIPQRPAKTPSSPSPSSISAPNSPSVNNNNNNNVNNNAPLEKKKSKGFMGKIGKLAKSDTTKGLVQFGLQQVVGHNLASSIVGEKDNSPVHIDSPTPSYNTTPSSSSYETNTTMHTITSSYSPKPTKVDFNYVRMVDRKDYPEFYTHELINTYCVQVDKESQAENMINYSQKGEPSTPEQEKRWIDNCYFQHLWHITENVISCVTPWSKIQEGFNLGYLDLHDGGKYYFDDLETAKWGYGSTGKYHPEGNSSDIPAKRFWTKFLHKGGNPDAQWVIREVLPNGFISYYTLTTAEFKQKLPSFHPVNVWAGDVHYNFGYKGTFKPAYCWQISFLNFYNNNSIDGNNQPPSVPVIDGLFEVWDETFKFNYDTRSYRAFYRLGFVTLRQLKEEVIPRIHCSRFDGNTYAEGVPIPIGWKTILYPCQSAYPSHQIQSFDQWRATMPNFDVDFDSGNDYCISPNIEYCFGHVYWNYARFNWTFSSSRSLWGEYWRKYCDGTLGDDNNDDDDDDDYRPSYSSFSSSSSSYSKSSSSSSSSPSKTTASKPSVKEKPKENWYWAKVCNDCTKKCASCGKELKGIDGKAKLCWQECGFGLKKDKCVLCGKHARNQGKLGSCCKSKKAQTCCQCHLACRDH